MYRTVYTFNKQDFEERDFVSLSFYLPRNSIQSFLELCNNHLCSHEVSKVFQSDGTKLIKVKTFAFRIASLMQSLGVKAHSTVLSPVNVTHSFLRKERFGYKKLLYACYNPQTHKTELKTNSPFVIRGTQQVYNGKLWRRVN